MSNAERLTRRDGKGRAYFDDDGSLIRGANGTFHQKKDMTGQFIHQRFVALDKTIDRLAAYEDTNLEPEEIMGLCGMHERAKMAELLRTEENRPLTLGDLRTMDGEPVWVATTAGHIWALVDAQEDGSVLLRNSHGDDYEADMVFCDGAIYRYKPRGVK